MASSTAADGAAPKLHGRAFYKSLGSPKFILAPMVDQSEFAWRVLTRSFMAPEMRKSILAYSPMLHARLFAENPKFRDQHFQPLRTKLETQLAVDHQCKLSKSKLYLDGKPELDRPLFVQFCANSPDEYLAAAKYVQPFCDAVDLNLGCPQGIARKGKYGAFLQEDWGLIYKLINKLHTELDVPVTAKMRILDCPEKTLDYAKMILSAGASIITVHGRQREQKGHNTGLADWTVIRYLREKLPSDTVIFANGNVLQYEDIDRCLEATGADGVMSAEGNLYDPTIFATPPPFGEEGGEYWRGKDGKGGYRMDAVLRRYLDIIHDCVLQQECPVRKPLFVVKGLPDLSGGPEVELIGLEEPPRKKQKTESKPQEVTSINIKVMQAHLFHLLRPLVSKHTNIRDKLARCRIGNIAAFEEVLSMVEDAVKQGLVDYENGIYEDPRLENAKKAEAQTESSADQNAMESSDAAVTRCWRPWWICQPYVRPLPAEAIEKGAMSLSKKEKARLEAQNADNTKPKGQEEKSKITTESLKENSAEEVEIPKEGLVCG